MTKIDIYQGNQIGGCVTVISAEVDGKIHRIMIDYGASLAGSGKKEDFEYPWIEKPVDAVFFTHYHGDHIGRLIHIPSNIPLYMGDTARKVLINIKTALSKIPDKLEAKLHQEELKILLDEKRVKTFQWNRKIHVYDAIDEISGFHIEPYSIDHSAYDAYMFLIEASDMQYEGGKKVILHTGDFRGHGRRGKAMIPMIQKYVHKNNRKVHSLIVEGTMMGRLDEKVKTETEMMFEAAKYMKKHQYTFLICSSTNLDSLASFYQAAQMAACPFERYLYVYNDYLKTQLKTFSDTAGSFSQIYQFHNVHRLNLNKRLKSLKWKTSMTQKELMEKTGFLAIIKPEAGYEEFLNPFVEDFEAGIIKEIPLIIYSMWDGYVEEDNKAKNQEWIDFLKKQEAKGVKILHLHTSGHAEAKMLADVINAAAPQEEIRPMHTEYPKMFEKLEISEEYKKRIEYSQ